MKKLVCLVALLAPPLLLSACGDDVTKNITQQTAPVVAAPAHHQGETCSSCHTDWNLVQMHDAASPSYNDDCITCHGDMSDETTLSNAVLGIHPRMCPYVYQAAGETEMNNNVCRYCHQSVDFLDHSAGNLRRQVDVDLCQNCHTRAGPGRELYEQ